MYRKRAIIFWLIGFIVLIILIRLPIPKSVQVFDQWSLPLANLTVVIDPGHGGPDGGAIGADGTAEKEITLAVSKKIVQLLQQAGAHVELTRDRDKDLAYPETKGLSRRKSEDIRQRLERVHQAEADLFLTVHLNAMSSSVWRGAQTFYHPKLPESKLLAENIQASIIDHLENTTREALPIQHIYLLKHAEIPGALVELGFLSNASEREQLKDEAYQQRMAQGIYDGILQYLTAPSEIPE